MVTNRLPVVRVGVDGNGTYRCSVQAGTARSSRWLLIALAMSAIGAWSISSVHAQTAHGADGGIANQTDAAVINRKAVNGDGSCARIPDWAERAFAPYIREAANLFSIPTALLWALIAERGKFNPHYSDQAGRVGLMGLPPRILTDMGAESSSDPRQNILAGARYLRVLNDAEGNTDQTIANFVAAAGAPSEAATHAKALRHTYDLLSYCARFRDRPQTAGPVHEQAPPDGTARRPQRQLQDAPGVITPEAPAGPCSAVLSLRVGMSRNQVARLLGPPKWSKMEQCGGARGVPRWKCEELTYLCQDSSMLKSFEWKRQVRVVFGGRGVEFWE